MKNIKIFALFFASLVLLFACSGVKTKQDSKKSIAIGQYEYSREQIRQYLYEVTLTTKSEKKVPLLLWGNNRNRIGYSIVLTDDLDVDFFRQSVTNAMEYYSDVTGVEFYLTDDAMQASIVIGIGTSFSGFANNSYIEGISRMEKLKPEEDFVEFLRIKDEIGGSDGTTEYEVFHPSVHKNAIADMQFPGERVLFAGYRLIKLSNGALAQDTESLAGIIWTAVYEILDGKFNVSDSIETSIAHKPYGELPYVWPFDEALLKVVYHNPRVSGMPIEQAAEIIIDELDKKYGAE